MSHSPNEDWRPEPEEPEPQNALERLIQQAAEDPSVQGKMFRLMMESDLYVYVPPHSRKLREETELRVRG